MFSPVKIWRNQKKIRKILGLRGKVVTFTQIFVPPVGFASEAPYVVAIVKLDNGITYTAQLVDFEEEHLKIGQMVKTVLRRTSESEEESVIPYGVKFKPI